jgi:hypothetical protein
MGGVVEIEEAAADMFLNWVYRRTETGGFSNTLWRGTLVAILADALRLRL